MPRAPRVQGRVKCSEFETDPLPELCRSAVFGTLTGRGKSQTVLDLREAILLARCRLPPLDLVAESDGEIVAGHPLQDEPLLAGNPDPRGPRHRNQLLALSQGAKAVRSSAMHSLRRNHRLSALFLLGQLPKYPFALLGTRVYAFLVTCTHAL